MASLPSTDTLDTQIILELREKWLGQSEAQPQPQVHAGQKQPQNVIDPPPPRHILPDESMDAVPIDFTLSSQTPQRAVYLQGRIPHTSTFSKSSPFVPFARDEQVRNNMHWSGAAGFPGHDGAGDTQPMDSQIFRDHSDLGLSKSVIEAHIAAAKQEQLAVADSELVAGEDPEVDLTDDGDNGVEDDDDLSSLNRTDDLSPAAHARIQAQTKALFKQPETPLPGSRKRNRRGELVSSEFRTSSTRAPESDLRRMFGANTGADAMNMTQLFQQTQVYSSPPACGPHSDTVFDRPSPGMQLRQSSPRHAAVSSPIRPSTSDGIGNIPLNTYRTMQESQESRLRRLRHEQEQRMLNNLEEDELDDSLADLQKRNIWQRQKKLVISNVELKAPDRLHRFPRNGRSKSADHLSSDNHLFTPAPNISKLQPMSPDPISDTVDQLGLPDPVQEDDLLADPVGVQVPMTSSKPLRRSQCRPSQQPSPSSSQRSIERDLPTQLSIAVHDSQDDRQNTPKLVYTSVQGAAPSSAVSGHRVVQSQYSVITSETHAMLSQRLRAGDDAIPNALQATRNTRARVEDAIRSSPPIFSEHDHEFDGDSDVEVEVEEQDEDMADVEETNTEWKEPETAEARHKHAREVEEVDHLPAPALEGYGYPEEDFRMPMGVIDTGQIALHSTAALHSSPAPDREDIQLTQQRTTGDSTTADNFETATTHQTPASSSRVQELARGGLQSQLSPIKRVTEIVAAPSPRRSGESYDLDSLVDNIFSDGDRDFMKTMNNLSPARPTKRTRVYTGKRSILREPSLNANLPKTSKDGKVVALKEADISGGLASAKVSIPAPQGEELVRNPKAEGSVSEPSTSANERDVEEIAAALEARTREEVRKVAPSAKSKRNTRKPHKILRKTSRSSTTTSTENARDVQGGRSTPNVQAEAINDAQFVASQSTTSDIRNRKTEVHDEASDTISPSRILALFKDTKLYYYPATYMETIYADGEKFKVKFDDGTVAIVDPMQVRSFELRENDCVKVDMDGMRKGTYLIQGFDDVMSTTTINARFSDVAGHKAVRVVPKTSDGVTTTQDPFVVSAGCIYLTGGMFPTFADRIFTPPSKGMVRFSTPTLQISEPTTPGSRSKRQVFTAIVPGDHINHMSSGLFSNMLFAVTFVNEQDQSRHKDSVVKQIISHGGGILDHGFDDIFESDTSVPTSPKKHQRARSTDSVDIPKETLRLRSGTQYLGFTAVIADRHCRKEKYLQALALGIPCLHHRWVTDCIGQSVVLPFSRYLLPAGESEFLSGAVHSRILTPYDPNSEFASLQQVLERRLLPLRDATVLLVMNTADRRKAYQFLAYAAGASSVHCVHNMNEAKKYLEAGIIYDWALCDGDKVKVREALCAPKQEANRKKRKRNNDALPSTPRKDMKAADSEFLVQSLILGSLADL